MENLPVYVTLLFTLTTLLAIFFLYKASAHSRTVLRLTSAWLLLQGAVALSGFYLNTQTLPPRLLLLLAPPFLLIAVLFASGRGRAWTDSLDVRWLTFLHTVRVPVEITLLLLFLYGYAPQLMTFEGRNFDIIVGLTAPLITWLGYQRKKTGTRWILYWNFMSVGLLINIVVHGILSVPTPFQQLAFDQPNTGLLHFPFVWLPGFIVPLVFFAHLVCIRQLIRQKKAAVQPGGDQLIPYR
jgi:hypothetical protein